MRHRAGRVPMISSLGTTAEEKAVSLIYRLVAKVHKDHRK